MEVTAILFMDGIRKATVLTLPPGSRFRVKSKPVNTIDIEPGRPNSGRPGFLLAIRDETADPPTLG